MVTNMNHISRISVFIQVVKHTSFVGAARALGMTGPAISKQVKALEDQLGVKLLTRTTRHVALTEEGAIYFDRARKALEDLSEAEQHIQELKAVPAGKLKISAPTSFGNQFLTKPIATFAARYPDVELDVDFSDRRVDVIREGYDLVVRVGVLEDSTLIASKLASCPLVLCASQTLIEQYGPLTSAEQLPRYPGLVYNQHSQKEEWRFQKANGEIQTQTLNRNFAANTADMQLEACLTGVGIALLPIFTVYPYLESGELIKILPEYKTYPESGIYVLYPQNRYLATRTRLFIDSLKAASKNFSWC